MTSDARVRPPEGDDAVSDAVAVSDAAAVSDEPRGDADGAASGAAGGEGSEGRSRPLVAALSTLLVILLAAGAFLWFTRPDPSAIATADYSGALVAARSGIKDLTSFDYLTLDDDIEQIRRVTTGDLREESLAELEDNRQQIVGSEAIVNTEVISAGVTRADSEAATVVMVIKAIQESTATPEAQVSQYRVQVELQKENDRWVLSGISGR